MAKDKGVTDFSLSINVKNLFIVADESLGYKVTGEDISQYYPGALHNANERFLEYYDRLYRELSLARDLNLAWISEADPKDTFWGFNYLLFVIALIRSCARTQKLNITITGAIPRYEKKCIVRVCSELGDRVSIAGHVDVKQEQAGAPGLKTLAKSAFSLKNNIRSFRRAFFNKYPVKDSGRSIGFHIRNARQADLYVKARYADLPGLLAGKEYRVFFFSDEFALPGKTSNIKVESRDGSVSRLPLYTYNSFISPGSYIGLYIESIRLHLLSHNKITRLKKQNTQPEFGYLLDTLQITNDTILKLLVARKGFKNLAAIKKPGVIVYSGLLYNKMAGLYNSICRQYNIRTFSISNRIMTRERLSNRLTAGQKKSSAQLPHAVAVFDQVSDVVFSEQAPADIAVYRCTRNRSGAGNEQHTDHPGIKNPDKKITVTLILQRVEDNMEEMIDSVIRAVDGSGGSLHLKAHPGFPVPGKLQEKYRHYSQVEILPVTQSLEEAADRADLCITAYSTAALEFAKKGRPVIWLNYITINSLLYLTLQDRIGLVANNEKELQKIVAEIIQSTEYYVRQSRLCYDRAKELVFPGGDPLVKTLLEAIEQEYSYTAETIIRAKR
jgi:hypothetical protein